ncbi:MAG: FtsX-like permease family protein [Bryobacterales bacterium]|nr:FtsX-like permease family protein [Bryobacterales bacterium]
MRALDIKLFRDLWHVRGQVIAIACVLGAGIATYVMSAATLDSLLTTQASLYRQYRFPEFFVGLKRAPASVRDRVAALPGVQVVEDRVIAPANIELPSYAMPVSGSIISLPEHAGALNLLHVHAGRLPEPGRDNEAVVSDGFAKAHKLIPDFPLNITINGKKKVFRIVGVVSTPEVIYQLAPGSIVPDFKSYCILWMQREPLEAAYNMTGAFNELVGTLTPGTQVEDVAAAIDAILRPYGGQGVFGRETQISHRYLSEEFKQLGVMATVFPVIFLSVAAFLLNVVVGRLMATQRGQIAILKAFGYSTASVVWHFLKFTAVIAALGLALGIAGGHWLGSGMAQLYKDVYRFPYLEFSLRPGVLLVSALVSIVAAGVGTVVSVMRSAAESPAVAMQPAPPGTYNISLMERLGARWFAQPTRMILRNIERRPMKSLMSIGGVAMSTGILVLGGFWGDAVDYMVFAQLRRAQLEDISVTFVGPVSNRALYSLASLPGVSYVEPTRSVAARLRFEQNSYRTAITGIEPEGRLRRLLNDKLQPVEVPPEGILLTDHLGKMLGVKPGDTLTVELLEGSRAVRQVPVAALVSEYIGVAGYMHRDSLNRVLREGDSLSGAFLQADMSYAPEIYRRLKAMPAVAGTGARAQALESFYETIAKQMLTFAFFNVILASTIAIGVVYNTVRIALSERSRELASLRVLGYTRGEVAYILLGELAVLVFLAIPAGLLFGRWLAGVMAQMSQTELFRVPVVVDPSTYALAALVVAVSTVVSAAAVGRKVSHLDLVEVLKARE